VSREAQLGQPDPVTETHAAAVVEVIDGHIYRIVYSEGAASLPNHTETLTQLAISLLMANVPQSARSGRTGSPAPQSAESDRRQETSPA